MAITTVQYMYWGWTGESIVRPEIKYWLSFTFWQFLKVVDKVEHVNFKNGHVKCLKCVLDRNKTEQCNKNLSSTGLWISVDLCRRKVCMYSRAYLNVGRLHLHRHNLETHSHYETHGEIPMPSTIISKYR